MSPRLGVDTSTLVHGAAQEVAHTASRRSGPRKWLRAVRWLISAGLHPKVNATTLKVAEDLAGRMDYDTGHARYLLDEIVARTGISRATVKRHVGYLRELGALAWVQHGTRANIRRALGMKGYAATATVYAAVIPACYDHAMGHRIVGSGYQARIVVDLRDCKTCPKGASKDVHPVDNPPVDNSSSTGLEPPSLTLVKKVGQVQMVGGFNYTPRKSASRQKPEIPHQSSSKNGRRRTAADVQQAMTVVRLVRALVNWTQRIPLRRLEYVLRPLTDRGLDAFQIADELHGLCSGMRWRPKQPDRFIHTRLAADAQQQAELAAAVPAQANTEWQAWRAQQQSLAALFAEPERTDADRKAARMDWNIWPEVAAHLEEDPDDANDLYGEALCKFAISQQARLENSYA